IFDDSSQEDQTGSLSATALTGFGMANDLDFHVSAADMPFGEPPVFPGGISYGSIGLDPNRHLPTDVATSTIEVLNVLLGQGNDHLTITSTLVPGVDHNPDGSLGTLVAVHGGITTVHGGGNSLLSITGTFTVSGHTITRTDNASWADAG